jgi:hypothetical protein
MVLLLASSLVTDEQSLAYGLLLLATASLGAGFGFTVPALSTLTAAFNPDAVNRSILALNALLGVGTVLAPVFVALFDGLGIWWGRNWSQLDMTSELGASTAQASLALTVFWAMVTAGRVLFAAVQRAVPPRLTYHILPFFLALVFVVIALLPDDDLALGILTFGLAGLGCSALLPLTIGFGQEELTTFSAAIAGGVIAFYQLGYGIAAFGVGPLLDSGVGLPTVYAFAAFVAAAMGAWSFVVAGRGPSAEPVHPQPG